ncbi:MAG: hypothetical protein AB1679_25920 [Actinomycetota bacterium]
MRDERRGRLGALFADPLWVLLFVGLVAVAVGLAGVFLALARVRPEIAVLRQMPYVVSAIAFGTLALLGALTCCGFVAWRAFGQVRTLTSELEEAAAALMWERVAASETERRARPAPAGTDDRPAARSSASTVRTTAG